MQFKLFLKMVLFFSLFAGINTTAQQSTDSADTFIGMIKYGNYSFLVSHNGIKLISKNKSINQQYTEYYKKIYGEDAENPNYVIEGNGEFNFVPLIPINQLTNRGIDSVDGFPVSKLYGLEDGKKVDANNKFLSKLQNLLQKQIMRKLENNKN
jgi:hypothetical protein